MKTGNSTVLWWVGWILLTLGSFFVACYFWTWFIAKHIGSVKSEGVSVLWVAAVFGTWMVLLLPLIVLMYNKVDKAYEDARLRREAMALKKAQEQERGEGLKFRTQMVESSKRILKEELRKKVKKFPQIIRGGQLVTARLRDGRKIENVFIVDKKEILGVYGLEKLSFDIEDIVDLEAADLEHLPRFDTEQWLRLDGVSGEDRE